MQVKAGETSVTLLQSRFITQPEGTPMWVSFDADSLSYFDSETKENVLKG